MAEKVLPGNLDEINQKLADVSAQIFPDGLLLKYVAVDDVREQNINPRSMPQRMMEQLTENIKAVSALESVPLCVYVDKAIEIISGHHRIRAARAAGLKYILVLLYTELPRSRVRSKQLAHNTISGVDDPEMVKRVFEEIADIQARFEAYVDPRILNMMPDPVSFAPIDVNMQDLVKQTLIVFLPSQLVDFKAAVEALLPKTELDQVYLASRESYDAWRSAIRETREVLDIVSIPTAIAEMARLAMKQLEIEKAKLGEAEQTADEKHEALT
jgi:hypothetical protein